MSLGRRISCTPRVPQFTPGSRLQVCANDVEVVTKSLRIIGETEAGGLLPLRAGLASVNLVSPPSLSAQSQVLSSLPPRPPTCPAYFPRGCSPAGQGALPTPTRVPELPPPRVLSAPPPPFASLFFPGARPPPHFSQRTPRSSPMGQLDSEFSFLPFFGMFPCRGAGPGHREPRGNARRWERAVRCPPPPRLLQTSAELGDRSGDLIPLWSGRAQRRPRGGRPGREWAAPRLDQRVQRGQRPGICWRHEDNRGNLGQRGLAGVKGARVDPPLLRRLLTRL